MQTTSGFRPLAHLLHQIVPGRFEAIRLRVADLDRKEVFKRFHSSFNADKRIEAFFMADELIARGIPPCFWHSSTMPTEYTLEKRYDLMLFDLRWLRYWHADHFRKIRYARYRALLIDVEAKFHHAAEFAFYMGKRPSWKIVGSLSMTEQLQWDCAWLRSAPLKKRHAATLAMMETVQKALASDLQSVRRTANFTQENADEALVRRTALWLCSRMTDNSPTETAIRYTQMTGEHITRQTAGKQLEKIRIAIRKKEMNSNTKLR